MLDGMKRLAHRCFRACGFDIRSVKNLDAALAEQERRRRERYLRRVALARSRRLEETPPLRRQTLAGREVDIVWVEARDLVPTACARLLPADSVLDVGCGIRPQPYLDARIHICCEPCRQYLDRLMVETAGDARYVYLRLDLAGVLAAFPLRSVDTVFLLEVLEHLDRAEAKAALAGAVGLARKQVVVSTPIGFLPQAPVRGEEDQWGMGGGRWQEHRSAWQPEDFPAAEGWEVIACREYHARDAHGRPLETPVGAMWAIRHVRSKEGLEA